MWIYDAAVLGALLARLRTVHFPRSLANLLLSFELGIEGEFCYYAAWVPPAHSFTPTAELPTRLRFMCDSSTCTFLSCSSPPIRTFCTPFASKGGSSPIGMSFHNRARRCPCTRATRWLTSLETFTLITTASTDGWRHAAPLHAHQAEVRHVHARASVNTAHWHLLVQWSGAITCT